MTSSPRLKRLFTPSNIKIATTLGGIIASVASIFGVIAPETATRLRNEVLLPLGVVSSMAAGDL